MTDDRPTEGITGDNCDSTMPLTSNANENRQIPETSSSDSSTLPNTDARTAYNLSVRTAERSRILAESISSTFERNLALLQHGTVCNVRSLCHRMTQSKKQSYNSLCYSLAYH